MLVWVHIVSPREPLCFLSLSRFSIPLFFCVSAVLSRVSLRLGSRLWNDCQILCNTTNNSRWKGVEILFVLFCFCLEEEHFVCMAITKLWDIPIQVPYDAVCSFIVLKWSPKKTSNAKVSGPAEPASYHKICANLFVQFLDAGGCDQRQLEVWNSCGKMRKAPCFLII